MAKLKITIDRGNAAFSDGADGPEVARILRTLADKLEGVNTEQGGEIRLFDSNGNRVGACIFGKRKKES